MSEKYRKCVAIVLRKNNQIFVGERIKNKNAWQLPQGGVDEGETYLEAAVRELYEETGITSVEFVLNTKNTYKYKYPRYLFDSMVKKYGSARFVGQEVAFCVFDFIGDDSEVNLNSTVAEFSNWKWTTAEDVINSIIYFKRKVYVDAFKEISDIAFKNMLTQ